MDIKRILNKNFLESLKYKLSIGNTRSIYLNCVPGRFKGRIELFEIDSLLGDIGKYFLEDLLTKSHFSFNFEIPIADKEISKEVKDKKLLLKSKLDYLIAENKVIQDNLGISTLHFGYPVIAYKKSKDSKFVYAPLLLWEVNLEKNFKKKNSYVLTRSEDLGIKLNDMFTILLEDDAQIKIDPIDGSFLEDGFIDKNELNQIIEKVNKQLFNKRIEDFSFNTDFTKLDKDQIKSSCWINSGVFGNFMHLKTPIIKEIQRLIEEFEKGNVVFSDLEFKTQTYLTSLETDPSQRKIIDSLGNDKNQIIQGPPGTGKSQTITAIISNILANKGKCLVVCEKDAALNVIKENLLKAGIQSGMVLKITDPFRDRRAFSDHMTNILDKGDAYKADYKATSDSLVAQNNLYKGFINNAKNKLYSKNIFNTPFRDLIGKLSQITRQNNFIHSLDNNFDKFKDVNIQILKESLINLQGKFQKIENESNFLSAFDKKFISGLNPIDYKNFLSKLNGLHQKISEIILLMNEVNSLTNSKFFNKSIKVSQFDKFFAVFSKNIQQINKKISTLTSEIKVIQEKHNELPLIEKKPLDTAKIAQAYYDELNHQIEHVQKLMTFDQKLLYEYKDLLNAIDQLDVYGKEVFDHFMGNEELKKIDRWDLIFEKSIIEYFLKKDLEQNSFQSGETINEYIKKLIEGEEDERKLNTIGINALWHQELDLLKILPNISSLKFYLTQKRESAKRGPRKSLQNLFKSYGKEIIKICPVILTNPVTANILFSEQEKLFDIVLFDEASQLRLEDTMTCMLLGKKIIISGDKHQMPPSSYFDNGIVLDDSEELDEPEEEFVDPTAESLLAFSYTLIKYFEDRMLECHYRSRHPDLINFSNYAFYGGRLMPMPAFIKYNPIKFHQVDGVYQQKQRVNPSEVNKIIELLKSEEINEDQSIGIATLNINQRDLIREGISNAIEEDEVFREKMNKLENNGLFIKNLENIQGDERDIIILSVTFGVNEEGKFSAHFGPLNNKNKGYKLLNVLITRAKHKLYIFNSIPQAEFNKFKNFRFERNEILNGKGAFYAYLAYAHAVSNNDHILKNSLLLEINTENSNINGNNSYTKSFSESPFEEEVYAVLLKHLPEKRIVQQYEAGGFRIDMVILDELLERPLLAIECDGAAYHSSDNAYAWDIYRQKMLEKMGFIFHRVWSTDWWVDYESEIKKILEKL